MDRILKAVKDETGVAMLLVLLAVFIFAATVIVISSGQSTQGNVSSMVENSEVALLRAEEGLNLAIANVNAGTTFNPIAGTSYTTDGWNVNISIQQVDGANFLVSTATSGRYSRTVARGVTITPAATGPGVATDFSVLTGGNMVVESVNFNSTSAVHANGNVDMTVRNYSGGRVSAGGTVNVNVEGANNGSREFESGVDPIPFPELNFDALAGAADFIYTDQQLTRDGLSDQIKNNGGVVLVRMTSDATLHLNNNEIFKDLKGSVTFVFVKDQSYSGAEGYTVKLNGNDINVDNVNFLADQGKFEFYNMNYNAKKSVIYTNYETKAEDEYAVSVTSQQNNFQVGGIISRGNVYMTAPNFDGTTADAATNAANWLFLNNLVPGGNPWGGNNGNNTYTFNIWREL